ncbi:MAG: hypothetical protein AAGC81_16195 [Pseudomonadota bacterium]
MDLITGYKVLLPPFWIDMITNSNLPYSTKSALATCVWIGLSTAYLVILFQLLIIIEGLL